MDIYLECVMEEREEKVVHNLFKEWIQGFDTELFKKGDKVKIVSDQVLVSESSGCATARVTIFINDEEIFLADVPWMMPIAECVLLMQVYILSQTPNYEHAKWQKTLEKFCYMFEEFRPPEKIWWLQS